MPVPLSLLESGSTRLQFPKEDESLGVDFTGRVIDSRYRVIRKIGEGGMGTVYAGEHVEIGKDVAIKILHPPTRRSRIWSSGSGARRAPPRASATRTSSTSPTSARPRTAAPTSSWSTSTGSISPTCCRTSGGSAPQRACQIAIQICRALAAAHAAGVIHRDLKPENIFLVARDGQADFVKVLDFGIARSMGRARRLTNPGMAMGTPEYMAPEQAEGGAVDQRSDIYSVGALIYEMISGSPPQMSRDKELIPPRGIKADVPEELDRIVVRALDPVPARRYQSMAQFEYDLAKSLYGRPRAVAEMLGLHDQERGVVPAAERSYSDEAPGGRAHPRADSPPPILTRRGGGGGVLVLVLALVLCLVLLGRRRVAPPAVGRVPSLPRAPRGAVGGTPGPSRRWRWSLSRWCRSTGGSLGARTASPRRRPRSRRPRRRATPIAARSACAPAWRTWSGCWGAGSGSRSSRRCRTGWPACAPTAAPRSPTRWRRARAACW